MRYYLILIIYTERFLKYADLMTYGIYGPIKLKKRARANLHLYLGLGRKGQLEQIVLNIRKNPEQILTQPQQ